MQILYYKITLLDDVILSSSSTTAEHHTLDYIPGNALLGILAGRLYQQLSPQEAIKLFYSAKVRFNNAYINNALPVPLSWYSHKGQDIIDKDGYFIKDRLFDLSFCSAEDMGSQQPRQLREHFVDQYYKQHIPLRAYRLKTAIDPVTEQVKKSQLFGYQHLLKDQSFYGHIMIDTSIDATIIAKIKTKLEGRLRLGRSKGSQYGRASLEWLENADTLNTQNHQTDTDILTIWCLSDCCVLNLENGQPALQILPEHIGLTGSLIKEKTFIRTRRYIPHNAYRNSHDLERQVISKGSIISIKLPQSIPSEDIKKLEYKGIGLFKEQGLGQIAINHAWLMPDYQIENRQEDSCIEPSDKHSLSEIPAPKDSLLCQWLAQQEQIDYHLQTEVEEIINSLKLFYRTGRRFHAVAANQYYGLSVTQWGHLYDSAKNNRVLEDLNNVLFIQPDALCKAEHNEEWTIPVNEKHHSFSDWLEQQVEKLQQKTENNKLREQDISIILTQVAKKARTASELWLIGRNLEIKND